MADKKITQLNSLTKSTIAGSDVIPVVDVSASETKKITFTELMNPLDSIFKVVNASDTTKVIQFDLSAITPATTRTLTIPDFNMTLVGTTAAQTLSNKILTAPQINFGSDARGDLITRDAGGNTIRLAAGLPGSIPSIDASGDIQWIPNPAASDGSTTVKGVFEEATQAEMDAGTTIGATGAHLVPTPALIRAKLINSGVVDTGSSTAYAIAPTPAIAGYATYQEFTFQAVNANTVKTPTLAVNGLTAKTITREDGSPLFVGDIIAGSIIRVVYDGTKFRIIGQKINTANLLGADPSVGSYVNTMIDLTLMANQIALGSPLSTDWVASYNLTKKSYGNSVYFDGNTATQMHGPIMGNYTPLGSTPLDFSRITTLNFFVPARLRTSITGVERYAIGLFDSAGSQPDNKTAISDSVRFVIDATKIYAVTGNGVATTVIDVTGSLNPDLPHDYAFSYEKGVKAEFWIDGVLVHTETNTLPTAVTQSDVWVRGATGGGASYAMWLGQIFLSQKI